MLFGPKEKGQGLVEYALILVLIAIVVIAALMILEPFFAEGGYRIWRFVTQYGFYFCVGFVGVFFAVLAALYVWFDVLKKDRY